MALITAKALKAREQPEFTIDLGDGIEVRARRPDMQLMLLRGLIPTPLFNGVMKMVGQWAGKGTEALTEEVLQSSLELLSFVNIFVCEAMVEPRVVPDDVPIDANENCLHVSDLTLATRKNILVTVTMRSAAPEVAAAAETFPEERPGEGSRSDVPEVSPAAV